MSHFFANSWKLNRATFQRVIDWYRKVLMQRRTFVNDVLKYSSYVANDVQRYKVACRLPGDRVRCFHLAIRHKAHVVDRCVSRIHNFFFFIILQITLLLSLSLFLSSLNNKTFHIPTKAKSSLRAKLRRSLRDSFTSSSTVFRYMYRDRFISVYRPIAGI